MVTAPVIAAPVQKTAGISTRSNWTAEVVDLMELVKAVAAGTHPLSLLQADTAKLTQMAKALKSELNIPGVRAVENVSPEKARKMARWFGRNRRFADAPKDSPAWVSFCLWGGHAGDAWSSKLVRQMNAADNAT
jgi:membrane peptidoglycan carboxypeptidase